MVGAAASNYLERRWDKTTSDLLAAVGMTCNLLASHFALSHLPSLIVSSWCFQLVRIRVGSAPVCQQPARPAPLVLLHPPKLTLDQHLVGPSAMTSPSSRPRPQPRPPTDSSFCTKKTSGRRSPCSFWKETVFSISVFFKPDKLREGKAFDRRDRRRFFWDLRIVIIPHSNNGKYRNHFLSADKIGISHFYELKKKIIPHDIKMCHNTVLTVHWLKLISDRTQ